MPFELQKIMPLAKVDEATRTVLGICTEEIPDSEDEICDYAAAKADYIRWSTEKYAATKAAGQDISYGNIRLQHSKAMGGKVLEMPDFNDAAKTISLLSTPKDEAIWKEIKGGFYTGYSHSGDYAWRQCNVCETPISKRLGNACPLCKRQVQVRYAPRVAEVSYVDAPSVHSATFKYVKADGSSEMRKFKEKGSTDVTTALLETTDPIMLSAENVTALAKSVAQQIEQHKLDAAAAEVAAAQKLEADKAAATEALAKAEVVKTAIIAQIDAFMAKGVAGHTLRKDLYSVSQFASLLSGIYCLSCSAASEAEWEGDDSTMPEQLKALLGQAVQAFLGMVEEETSELTAAAATKGQPTMDLKKQKADSLATAASYTALAKAFTDLADGVSKTPGTEALVTDHRGKAATATELAKQHTAIADAIVLPVEPVVVTPPVPDPAVAKAAADKAVADAATAAAVVVGDATSDVEKYVAAEVEKIVKAREAARLADPGKDAEIQQMITDRADALYKARMAKTFEPSTVKVVGATLVPRAGEPFMAKANSVRPGSSGLLDD